MNTENNTEVFPLRVPVQRAGVSWFFPTANDLVAWVEKEIRIWQQFRNDLRGTIPGLPVEFFVHQDSRLTRLLDIARAVDPNQNQFNSDELQRNSDRFKNAILEAVAGDALLSETSLGQRILNAETPDEKIGLFLISQPSAVLSIGNVTHFRLARAMSDARMGMHPADEYEAESKALATAKANWVQELQHAVDSMQSDHTTAYRAGRKLFREAISVLRQMRDRNERHSEKMENIETTFLKRMEIEAPIKYWSDKAAGHRKTFLISLTAFVVLAVSGASLGFTFLPDFYAELALKDGSVPPTALVVLAIPAIAILWLMRLISRVFVSSMRLQEDAELRKTMADTFIALAANEEASVEREDRFLILNALFRPLSRDGSDDDAPPPNLLEILKQRSSS